jgi:hypothetical protein
MILLRINKNKRVVIFIIVEEIYADTYRPIYFDLYAHNRLITIEP